MKRRVCVWVGSILGFGWCMAGGIALGQGVAPPPRPVQPQSTALAVQEDAAVVVGGRSYTAIQAFIADQVKRVTSGNADEQTLGRESLKAAYPKTGTATAAYRSAYASVLARSATPLLASKSPLRVRINLGVAIAGVANNIPPGEPVPAGALVPAVVNLLRDPDDAVALWGMKAARQLVVCLVLQSGGPGPTPLLPAVVKSVGQHANDDLAGFIAVDAYRALVVNTNAVTGYTDAQVWGYMRPLCGPVLDLLELRTGLYAKGIVALPDAEVTPPVNVPTFLSRAYNTAGMLSVTPRDNQPHRAIQDLMNFVYVAGQRAALADRLAPPGNRILLDQLRPALANAAGALNVISGEHRLDQIAHMPPGVTGANMASLTASVYASMGSTYGWLKNPPALSPIALPPAGATETTAPAAPATGTP